MTLKIPTGLTHATAVAINGSGLLIVGPSGCGKSGLALQLMAFGAQLVADDQVLLSQTATGIEMHPPETLRGRIEARYLGILECGFAQVAPLCLVVAIDQDSVERLPLPKTILVGSAEIDLIHAANVPNLAPALMVRFQDY